MKVYILGTGATIKQYTPHKDNISFGVNDIERYIHSPVKHLICVNPPSTFKDPIKIKTIELSKPETFHSVQDKSGIPTHWAKFHKNIQYMKHLPMFNLCVQMIVGLSLDKLKGDEIYHTSTSTFMAAVLAYRMYPDMKEIHFFGVDFINHNYFVGERAERELRAFSWLFTQLTKRGIKIFIPEESRLIEVL